MVDNFSASLNHTVFPVNETEVAVMLTNDINCSLEGRMTPFKPRNGTVFNYKYIQSGGLSQYITGHQIT